MKNQEIKEEQRVMKEVGFDLNLNVNLAVERTMYALERTQLAWVRTVLGLITAGIAIDKGVSALHQARLISGEAWDKNGHFAGLLLTWVGTLLMILVTVFYIIRMWQLASMLRKRNRLLYPGTLISVFICILGFLSVYFLTLSW
ncbi:MAG: DUF202 domain-containing protein [Bacteroidales bacterium]